MSVTDQVAAHAAIGEALETLDGAMPSLAMLVNSVDEAQLALDRADSYLGDDERPYYLMQLIDLLVEIGSDLSDVEEDFSALGLAPHQGRLPKRASPA